MPLTHILPQLRAVISSGRLGPRVSKLLVVRHDIVAEVLTFLLLRHLLFLALKAVVVQTIDVV